MTAHRIIPLELESARRRVRDLLAELRDDPEVTPERRRGIESGELRVALSVVASLEAQA